MKIATLAFASLLAAASMAVPVSSLQKNQAAVGVTLRMTHSEYLLGERIRAEVEVRNGSTTPIIVGAKE